MRKVLLLALTGALLVAMVAGTATAKGPGSGKSKGKGPATVTYVFEGKMAFVTEDGNSFKITVTGGNKAARGAVHEAIENGEPLSLTIIPEKTEPEDKTRVELNNQEASMADLQAGDKVVVQSKASKGTTSFKADKISAERAEEPTEPTESAPAGGEPAA